MVAPKRAALAEANKRLEGANKKLMGIRARVKELQDRVAALEDSLMKATEDKNNAVAQVGRQWWAGLWGGVDGSGDPEREDRVLAGGAVLSLSAALCATSSGLTGGAHCQQGGAGAAPDWRTGRRVRPLDGEHPAHVGYRG